MRSVVRSVVLFGLVTSTVASAGGCSTSASNRDSLGTIGTVGMQLTLPGNLVINQVAYTITGPSTYSGTINVDGASVIQVGVASVAPGSGYVLAENASTVDGTVVCSGASAPFSVSAGQTTAVSVALACTTNPEAGAIVGTTVASECAMWTSVFATPNETTVGGVAQISATATAPNPSALTYQWTASAGTLDTPSNPTATFTCPSTPGPVTITLNVSDGPIPPGGACPASDTTTTLTVTCDPAPDAGAPDSGPADTGATDTDASDANVIDAGADVGPDVVVALVPCTAPGQTACVACAGNASGLCSATESLLVQKDIGAGNAATTPCYSCLVNAGCIDDTKFGDTRNECDDLSGTFGAGPRAGTASSTLCLDTAACILRTSCASSAVSACYCGSSVGAACLSNPTPDGACNAEEVNGLGLTTSSDILKAYTNTTLPSGVANQIFQCAQSNSCTACLQ